MQKEVPQNALLNFGVLFIGRPLTPQAVDEETFNDMQDAVPTCLHLIHRYVRPRLIPPTPQRAPIAAPKNIVAAKTIQRSSLWVETTIFPNSLLLLHMTSSFPPPSIAGASIMEERTLPALSPKSTATQRSRASTSKLVRDYGIVRKGREKEGRREEEGEFRMKSKFRRAAVKSLHKLAALRLLSVLCVLCPFFQAFVYPHPPCMPLCPLGLNVYDIRIPCEVPGLCYDFSRVETFLQNPEVSCSALHMARLQEICGELETKSSSI